MLNDLLDVGIPPYQLFLLFIVFATLACYSISWLTSSIPSAHAGPLLGASNAKAMADYPITFLRQCSKKYGPIFRVNMVINSTYWLLDKQLNKAYLEMKEDVWSFSDGMVSRIPPWGNLLPEINDIL